MNEIFRLVSSSLVILLALQQTVQSESINKKVLLDRSGEIILVITLETDDEGKEAIKTCQVLTDKNSIEETLRSTPYSNVEQVSKEIIEDTVQECSELSSIGSNREELNDGKRSQWLTSTPSTDENNSTEGYSGIPVILPGTKWCGAGQRAKEIQDLGYYEDTDQCCRAHDRCNDTLAPGETKHNVTNKSTFTALSCQCDDEFYDCLEKINSIVSNAVGNMYFNILRRSCYTFDHPDGKCKTYRSLLKITCKEYEKNTSAPKFWQWVSPRMYKTLPIPGPLTITVDFRK